jgi:phosphatidylserine/phosphatidylglycerophosphate/cardiolipin synthase-like enzyme
VEVRIIGKLEKTLDGVQVRKLPDLRLHVRSIIRDGASAFVGSQSLRKLELDGRREIGVILTNSSVIKRMQAVFETDWAKGAGKAAEKGSEPTAPVSAA